MQPVHIIIIIIIIILLIYSNFILFAVSITSLLMYSVDFIATISYFVITFSASSPRQRQGDGGVLNMWLQLWHRIKSFEKNFF